MPIIYVPGGGGGAASVTSAQYASVLGIIHTRSTASSFSTPANIVGMSASLQAGGKYHIIAHLIANQGVAGFSTISVNASTPALKAAGSYMHLVKSGLGVTNAVSAVAAGVNLLLGASLVSLEGLFIEAFLNVSAAGIFQLMAGTSVGGGLTIESGFIRAFRVG